MSPRRRFVVLVLLGALLAGAVGAVASALLYRTAREREAATLNAVVLSQVAMAEAVFRDELAEHAGDTAAAVAGMLEQLRSSSRSFLGFGITGEFTVARLRGDTIVFDIGLRSDTSRVPGPVPLPSTRATLMQQALQGDSGVGHGTDYAGQRVTAAYAPIAGTGAGMVVKVDVAELRAPFVRAATSAGAVGFLLLLLALGVGKVVGSPLLAEVEERERAHRVLIDQFPGIFFQARVDEAGRWSFEVLEGAVEEITGFPAEHFLASADTWGALIHEDDRAAVAERAAAYAASSATWPHVEYRIRRRDGTVAWLRGIARARPEGEHLGRVVGSFLEVTEAHRRDEELNESRERLRLAILAGGHGLYDLDLRTGEAVVNEEYASMLGYDPATFVETNAAWRDRLHPDAREAVYAEYEAYVAGRRDSYRVEFRQRTAQGGWRWILSLGAIVEHDTEGRPVRMVGTHTDIQARKDAEAALRESEERFRRAVEASPEAIFIQTGGRFAYVNPSALALFGARADEELLGTPILDRFPPGRRETVQARMHALNVEGRAVPMLMESVLRSDGTEVQAEVTAVPFRYQGVDGALVFARDLTERVAAEDRLRAHVEELRRWQAAMLDREDRVQELKREVNELAARLGGEPRYPSQVPGVRE